MTTITIEERGERVILARDEWEKLLQLARKSENVEIENAVVEDGETSSRELTRRAFDSPAWQWLHDEPDLYSASDVVAS